VAKWQSGDVAVRQFVLILTTLAIQNLAVSDFIRNFAAVNENGLK
jgi:hypothetical protein